MFNLSDLTDRAMPRTPSSPSLTHFNEPFISALDAASPTNAQDDPNYYSRYPRSLVSTSNVETFMTGTGSVIYNSLTPLLESTDHELILVTCFWARSSTLETLNSILRKLSDKAILRGTEKICVQLCFSSSSLFQKLFHKQSLTGQTYPPSVWTKKLGLPDPSELGGLDLRIKSIFILPFSVMHPKFMIIDRKTVILPSCNISWEEWFEGAVTMSGSVVDQFLKFYSVFWERQPDILPLEDADTGQATTKPKIGEVGSTMDLGHGHMITNLAPSKRKPVIADVPTVFLPSPHRRNPRFQPFTSSEHIVAPPTPLNTFLLSLFAKAEKSIRIQTPNLTAPPVLSALRNALARGINVQILTSERLMILEQLVTAGTTTSQCVKRLIKRYRKLCQPNPRRPATDEEAALASSRPGRLQISYFEPPSGPKKRGQEGGEPQQSHLKLTIVDDEVLVLGSGNLDRASWFTSQELGVAFFHKGIAEKVGSTLDQAMQGRSKTVFDSGEIH
ncbi:phospholipase D/nuclease [Dothidotthia symphoricarpi CBS 119687]|uniref:Phospholipase D/nuclease n=1 Tax=Dothidotthia symphoricarpi CBS 119687 TaxID=1392245 RepID=A0A6A6A446_9PLEO|nr:phospholipase D/nuclease [Dothidotthia symphoricarpi CBS 119687]KAF2125687.1 phospholipase D/nuclease [Dothidotthia symphoricarpi CBS 119687]